jgi:hypothetical protein
MWIIRLSGGLLKIAGSGTSASYVVKGKPGKGDGSKL